MQPGATDARPNQKDTVTWEKGKKMAAFVCDVCGCQLFSPGTGAHSMVIMDLSINKITTVEVSENIKSFLCDDCLDEIKEVMEERKILYQDD